MVYDDTFIILKQNEQRRMIINIINETYAGKNNITTRTKVSSIYISSINIMLRLLREHVN